MGGLIIVIAVVVMVLCILVYLFGNSELFGKMRGSLKSNVDKVKDVRDEREVEIIGGPVLQVKNPGEKKYYSVTVRKKRFLIGRNKRCDLVLDDKTVEGQHAAIIKTIKGDQVVFKFINYAKVNPAQYYDKDKNKYLILGKHDHVDLTVREAFYIGDTKIIVAFPQDVHIPTDTERIVPSVDTKRIQMQPERTESTRVASKHEIDV